jgi:hypothetical protein
LHAQRRIALWRILHFVHTPPHGKQPLFPNRNQWGIRKFECRQSVLQDLLLHYTNAVPFLCLDKAEKRSMLVIGNGGKKKRYLVSMLFGFTPAYFLGLSFYLNIVVILFVSSRMVNSVH